MERWQRMQEPPSRRGCEYPSFSSTLLDSIYRSIDEEGPALATTNRGAPNPYPLPKKKQAPPTLTILKPPRGAPDRPTKMQGTPVTRPHHFHVTTSTTAEPEYAPIHPNRLKPIRTGNVSARSDPPPPIAIPIQPEKKKKNQNLSSIRSKFSDLKKSRSPMSPAAKLSSFLNSLFTSTPGTGRKHKPSAAVVKESACSTASSYSRSCLVKTPSMTDHDVKIRSVRFSLPVDGGKGRWEENRYGMRETMKKKTTKWRDYGKEDDDVASDSSSDLFELENLTGIGRYRDELPVYETTHFGGRIL